MRFGCEAVLEAVDFPRLLTQGLQVKKQLHSQASHGSPVGCTLVSASACEASACTQMMLKLKLQYFGHVM